jgi:hypothetical protein
LQKVLDYFGVARIEDIPRSEANRVIRSQGGFMKGVESDVLSSGRKTNKSIAQQRDDFCKESSLRQLVHSSYSKQ